MKAFIIFATVLFSQSSFANLPNYQTPEILARANINDGFNIPPMSFLTNTCPVINNHGDVAFKLMAVEGVNTQALWVKTTEDAAGKIMYMAPDERFLTDPTINESGKIAFNLYDEGVTDGLFVYDSKSATVKQVLNPDELPIQFYTYPQILNNGHIYFRATDDSDMRIFYEFTGNKLNKILAENTQDLGIKASYLFKPTVNEFGMIAFKTRLGNQGEWDESNPDQILLLTPTADLKNPAIQTMKVTTIARDIDSDPRSPYFGFGNTVSLSKHGATAFVAILNETKKKTIVMSKDNVLKNIAIEGSNDISEIEMFAPKINDQGLVLFRAKNAEGKRGLYLSDGITLNRIIGEGDDVMTDVGPGKILSNPNFPGFGGDVDMNDEGVIVFYCIIVDSANKELGSAVYKIQPELNTQK